MRFLHILICAIFGLMAAIQFNDPDPAYWIAVYAGVAWIALTAVFGQPKRGMVILVTGMVIAGLLVSGPGFVDYLRSGELASISGGMRDSAPYIESAREFLGLVIAAAALGFYTRQSVQ
jgi:hypothetical protein